MAQPRPATSALFARRVRSSAPATQLAAPTQAVPRGTKAEDLNAKEQDAAERDCVQSAADIVQPTGNAPHTFSTKGYVVRPFLLSRGTPSGRSYHCIHVEWPSGDENASRKPCTTRHYVDAAWLRAIRNTLLRIPWNHANLVRRIVIDNRPTEHGIAPFDREDPSDERDGHTLWLHEHLFRDPNHWASGNYGQYWAYHVDEDGVTIDGSPPDHDWFSPILLHEVGHLVMYGVVNAQQRGAHASNAPECAWTCAEIGTCSTSSTAAREIGCISPYCHPFRFAVSTENWAEQYRLYYQSSSSRQVLRDAHAGCLSVLQMHDTDDGNSAIAPWHLGLGDIAEYRRSRWQSCGNRACKAW